jgi:hypothetical protein
VFDGLVVADLGHHFFLVQTVGDEVFEFVETDAEGVEVMVHVGRPVQALDAAELVGPLLDFRGRDRQPGFFRRQHGELVAHQLFDQPLELSAEL